MHDIMLHYDSKSNQDKEKHTCSYYVKLGNVIERYYKNIKYDKKK